MASFRITSADARERVGESKWCHPAHLVSFEVESRNGIKRRWMPGIKSPSIFGGHITGALTDKKISAYIRNGTYSARHKFMAERKKQKEVEKALPRLVYDCSLQEFIEVT